MSDLRIKHLEKTGLNSLQVQKFIKCCIGNSQPSNIAIFRNLNVYVSAINFTFNGK
jgi:hypothetical protein